MSDPFIDRFYASVSLDGRDPITRSIGDAGTSGFIGDDAPHWSIESYLPLNPSQLIDYLADRDDRGEQERDRFRQCCAEMTAILRKRCGTYYDRFNRFYWAVDPDNDCRQPGVADRTEEPDAGGAEGPGVGRAGATSGEAADRFATENTSGISPNPEIMTGPSTVTGQSKVTGQSTTVGQSAVAGDGGPGDGGQAPTEPPAEQDPNDRAASCETHLFSPESNCPCDPGEVVAEHGAAATGTESDVGELIELCEEVLFEAGYRRLDRENIEECVGVASQWGVPLHVDFELFERLVVYARGDIVGTRLRRRLRRLYRPEQVSVPIYQRMFVMFQLKQDDSSQEELSASSLHMRMFKNIPKQDVDMLLPGSRVRITKIDSVKIIVPSLGGLLMSLRKIIQFMLIFAALTLYSTAVLVGLVLATIGYIVKSVLSYFQTKNRYLLNLTRNLYFQKLDTNAGAAYRAIEQAQRQTLSETILAYYAIESSEEPISTRRLRRRCERIIREAVGTEVDFRVDRALQRLIEMQRVEETVDQRWVVRRQAAVGLPPSAAT